MISVDCSSILGSDITEMLKAIREVTLHISAYIDDRNNGTNTSAKLDNLLEDIREITNLWSGVTYIGERKNSDVLNAFQSLFRTFMELLLQIKCNQQNASNSERKLANKLLFQGTVYRYLGHCDHDELGRVEPIYNDIYVSWSKKEKNYYIESKLYGIMTWMSCEIKPPLFGIDLEALGTSKGTESEVVFPTIEEYITEVKYLNEHDNEAENE